jgi:D-apionolactonase
MNRSIGLFGTAEPSAADQLVVCGRLSLRIRGGELRRVSFDGAEAVRSIAFVIRDRDWGTLALGTTSASLDLKADSFRYDYAARTDGAPVTVSITVTGSGDGQVSIEGEARVEGDFETNRTGFVILHPIEGVAGAPAEVVGSDGAPRHGRFPERISPGQPFFDIQEIRHGFAGGGAVHIRFAGEVFEMEDQRNWTDASFKTYCRPLGLPYPYRVEPQHPVRQGIRLDLSAPQTPPPPGGQAVELTLGEDGGETMPELALAFEPGWEPDDWQAVAALRPAALVSRLDVADRPDEGVRAIAAAHGAVGGACELEVVVDDEADPGPALAKLASLCREAGVAPMSVTALPRAYLKSHQPSGPWPTGVGPEQAAEAARNAFPEARIGGGMLTYFTEFNRCPPSCGSNGFATHATSAIVHAADDESVMETLECLPHVFGSARALIGSAGYRLGLVAIGMRSNPYGAATKENSEQVRMAMAHCDPRQRGLFGAAWALGALAATGGFGVERIALAAPAGPFGLVYRPLPVAQPGYDDRARDGETLVYPIYHVLRGLSDSRTARRVKVASSAPARVAALAYASDRGTTVWLANLSAEPGTVAIGGASGACTRLEVEDFDQAAAAPDWFGTAPETKLEGQLELGAYAIARLRLAQ